MRNVQFVYVDLFSLAMEWLLAAVITAGLILTLGAQPSSERDGADLTPLAGAEKPRGCHASAFRTEMNGRGSPQAGVRVDGRER
jgi:hypothetical protein